MMVYQHHERIDGSGYPVRLAGSEIHEWARSPLRTCSRPSPANVSLQAAFSPAEALEVIERGEAKGLDPEFLEMLEDDDQGDLRFGLGVECQVKFRVPSRPAGPSGPQPGFGQKRLAIRARFAFLTKTLHELEPTTIACIPRPHGEFAVLTTDVSRDGVAFLHVEQLYPGRAGHRFVSFTGTRSGACPRDAVALSTTATVTKS